MSISESDSQSFVDVDDEDDASESDSHAVYLNDRGDKYSDESSGYHLSLSADPLSKNKKYVRRMNPDTEKNVRVEFFPTSMAPNSAIKNAVSGAYQGTGNRLFRTGTKDEDLFFTVVIATGELGQTPPTLFYDNPEQYERHFFTKLSQETKEDWLYKRDRAMLRLKLDRKTAESIGGGPIVVK